MCLVLILTMNEHNIRNCSWGLLFCLGSTRRYCWCLCGFLLLLMMYIIHIILHYYPIIYSPCSCRNYSMWLRFHYQLAVSLLLLLVLKFGPGNFFTSKFILTQWLLSRTSCGCVMSCWFKLRLSRTYWARRKGNHDLRVQNVRTQKIEMCLNCRGNLHFSFCIRQLLLESIQTDLEPVDQGQQEPTRTKSA